MLPTHCSCFCQVSRGLAHGLVPADDSIDFVGFGCVALGPPECPLLGSLIVAHRVCSMLGCHIELVARKGWQAAGCVCFASRYPRLVTWYWLFLPVGKPRLLAAKLKLACCALPAQRCAKATCFVVSSPKTSKLPRDQCTGVPSRHANCGCREQASFASSLLCELTCHHRRLVVNSPENTHSKVFCLARTCAALRTQPCPQYATVPTNRKHVSWPACG